MPPAKKPALAESLLGLRVRCQRVHPWDLEPDALAGAVHQVNDILDDLLILLQDESLQSANTGKPQATKKARKSAKLKTNS